MEQPGLKRTAVLNGPYKCQDLLSVCLSFQQSSQTLLCVTRQEQHGRDSSSSKGAGKRCQEEGRRPKKTGPSVGELILKTVATSKERTGVCAAALKKALAAGGYDVEKNKSRVKTAIKALVAKGSLVETKGTGASSSFKMSKKTAEPKKVKKLGKKATPVVVFFSLTCLSFKGEYSENKQMVTGEIVCGGKVMKFYSQVRSADNQVQDVCTAC
ncbi:hypothetical protein ABVT39_010111 [Epinephelus coioides]